MSKVTCKKCGETKSAQDFYKRQYSRISGLGECKECTKARVRANRMVNLEYYREFDRKRANLPHRKAAREAYQQSDHGRIVSNAAKRRYAARPDRRGSHVSLGNAVRDGKAIKLDGCEYCGAQESLQGHHSSYAEDMRLCVTWLCVPCHARLHKEHREYMRASR